MKTILLPLLSLLLLLQSIVVHSAESSAPTEKSFDAPHGMKVSIKMISPYSQTTDLQIICVFKHKSTGDTYIGAMKDLDAKLGGLLSSLRNRGEFIGDRGETILFTPPENSITPKRMLVIGLGDESKLTLDTLSLVGRIALREAVTLKSRDVSFAPVIRDQGNNTLDVGAVDRAAIESVISAYDTEKHLQTQGLSPDFSIERWTIEAGPSYFDSAVKEVGNGIETTAKKITTRSNAPYSTLK